jgi:hypothetical protein
MSTGGTTGTSVSTSQTGLTSAVIDARVRQITRRDDTSVLSTADLTAYISEAVREISAQHMPLKEEVSGTLSGGSNTITAPTDMIPTSGAVDKVYYDSRVLDALTFDEWRRGFRRGWAYRDRTFYIAPLPGGDKTYTIYYRKYHPEEVSTISLNNDYKMAIVFLTASKVYTDIELYGEADKMKAKYAEEMERLYKPDEMAVAVMRRDS